MIEVSFIRNFNGTLYEYKRYTELNENEMREQQLVQTGREKSTKKLDSFNKKKVKEETLIQKKVQSFYVRNGILNFDGFPILGAYVIFNRYQDKMKVYKLFHKYNWNVLYNIPKLFRKCFCCKDRWRPNYRDYFRDKNKKAYIMSVHMDVDEPSDIKWENQDITLVDFYKRQILVYLIILGVMFISVLILLIANGTQVKYECKNRTWKLEDLAEVR